MAVGEGFEPSHRITPIYRFSKPAPSASWVPHQAPCFNLKFQILTFGELVSPVRLERTTNCLKGNCSNQLSYGPSSNFKSNKLLDSTRKRR